MPSCLPSSSEAIAHSAVALAEARILTRSAEELRLQILFGEPELCHAPGALGINIGKLSLKPGQAERCKYLRFCRFDLKLLAPAVEFEVAAVGFQFIL